MAIFLYNLYIFDWIQHILGSVLKQCYIHYSFIMIIVIKQYVFACNFTLYARNLFCSAALVVPSED